MKKIFCITGLILAPLLSFSQVKNVSALDSTYLNWHLKDYELDGIPGTSVEKLYNTLLKDRQPKKKVIVAIIDSGVDIEHEDLQGKAWVNTDEIIGNAIDDDQNGFVDDVYGWNFLGNRAGENIMHENFEMTRILREQKEGDSLYAIAQKMYNKELKKQQKEQMMIEQFENVFNTARFIIQQETGITPDSQEQLDSVTSNNQRVLAAKQFLSERYKMGFKKEVLQEYKEHLDDYFDYYLNKDFTIRKVVGDDPADISDTQYGNSEVIGPRANHGTSVAGVIAANRNNALGINGIADSVSIMTLRTVPNGDERDKDIALSIRYAVDNGADIINMSFGKDISPYKKFVDEAVRYAEENDVLLIHAAGNDGNNSDEVPNFPSDTYLNGKQINNWMSIAASTSTLDENIVASFSNYGQKHVDILSPGANIISLDSSSTYSMNDGTSLAAPIVTGVASLILSYFPKLSAKDLKAILMESAYMVDKPKKVLVPTSSEEKAKKEKIKNLFVTPGIVNAYNAFLLAEKRYEKIAMD